MELLIAIIYWLNDSASDDWQVPIGCDSCDNGGS